MTGPSVARLADGRRLHLQHGPIDLIIEVIGVEHAVACAEAAAAARFAEVLDELVPQLDSLRSLRTGDWKVRGPIARRMVDAVSLPGLADCELTPMAAVAGAVADEICSVVAGVRGVQRAYVNNGGDIALHLQPGESVAVGLCATARSAGPDRTFRVRADSLVRGVATSGSGGRSHSLGIADAVTVLAAVTAAADAAATAIANAVDLPGHPSIGRAPAMAIDASSDLGDRLVTIAVGDLDSGEVEDALSRGAERAEILLEASPQLHAVVISLRGHFRSVGRGPVGLLHPLAKEAASVR